MGVTLETLLSLDHGFKVESLERSHISHTSVLSHLSNYLGTWWFNTSCYVVVSVLYHLQYYIVMRLELSYVKLSAA